MSWRLGRFKLKPVVLGFGLALSAIPGYADDANLEEPILPGGIRLINGRFVSTLQEPVAPVQPIQPITPVDPVGSLDDLSTITTTDTGGASFGGLELLSQQITGNMVGPAPPPLEGVSQGQIQALPAVDLGGVLRDSSNIQTVSVQRRNPVSIEPRIRGFRSGQVYSQADGALFVPVRQDLDTMLNKLDPASIQQVIVVPGPYGVHYGPGFSFIDVTTADTPRYENGYEAHNRVGLTYQTNGGQVYFRDSYYGGNEDWGFRLGYGNRKGSDYEAGDGTEIPSSYQNQNFDAQLGFDINPWQKVEFRYNRLDQSDTEFPGLFFNNDYLVTDAWNVRLIDEDPSGPWSRMIVETWYNRTRFEGITPTRHEDVFRVIDRINAALTDAPGENSQFRGTTDGDIASTGARAAVTYGEQDEVNLTLGSDFRYVEQNLQEEFTGRDLRGGGSTPIDIETNLPRAYSTDPGLFAELSNPITSYWTTTIGTRIDFVHTNVIEDLRTGTQLDENELSQNDTLLAGYINNQVELDEYNVGRLGMGYAERVPTLVDRYADGVFLGVIQSGFSRVIGNAALPKERMFQIDVSLQGDYDAFRYRAGVFHSQIFDYSTYSLNVVNDIPGARLLQTVSTDYATLAGFEAAIEYDLTNQLTPFADISYVEGRDQEINRPLFGIAPLDTRAGLRWHDTSGGSVYGLEFFARIVDNQDRLGTIRVSGIDDVDVLERETPGFTVWNIRSYYNVNDNFTMTAGVDNLFDRTYLEHLDLRLPGDPAAGIAAARVLSPGITPYMGFEWTY